jgi:amino acid adenylation domain-containing protein
MSNQTVHALLEQSVSRYGAQTALVFHDQAFSYSEVDEKVSRLAVRLRREGVGPDAVVGLMAKRSPELIIGQLAILKSGGAYLPIDPKYPESRIAYMLQHSGSSLLLTDDSPSTCTNAAGMRSLNLFDEELYSGPGARFDPHFQPTNLAYVIYTSGSTGKPKGVAVEHRHLFSFIDSFTREIDFRSPQRILALTTLSFDISIVETLIPLTSGMTVVIADEQQQADMELLRSCIVDQQIDLLQVTPSRLRQLIGDGEGMNCLSRVSDLLVGGEAFPDHLFEQLKDCPCRVHNLYGPTEATVYALFKTLRKGEKVTLGKPLSNTEAYIADDSGRLLSTGKEGELLLGGSGVARGYLNAPELTVKSFQPAPFQPDRRIYRTGDRARWTPTGEVEFLGRVDRQVKLRGYRIELGEIENLLLAHPQIKAAVVEKAKDANQNLCAYIVPHAANAVNMSELRHYLARSLPDYMVPAFVVELPELPLMPNGKIDYEALPKPAPGSASDAVITDSAEERIVSIWSALLGIPKERIGPEDDFFALGGHSLSASLAIARMHSAFDVRIPLADFFDRATPRALAQYVKAAGKTVHQAIPRTEVKDRYPLSSEEARQFVLYQLAPQSCAYNLPEIYEVQGSLDIERVEQVFRMLVDRHESLRTSFEIDDGVPWQKVHPHVPFAIKVRDVDEDAVRLALQEFVRPFDLACAPLLRVEVLRVDARRFFFMLDIHHIIADGFSRDILLREFLQLYAGQELSPLAVQYKDYAESQQHIKNTDRIKQQKAYWLEVFNDPAPPLELPLDFPRPYVRIFEGRRLYFKIAAPVVNELKRLACEENASLFMTLFSVVSSYLNDLTGQEDLVIATPIAGRDHADLEPVIGMFVNMLAVRTRPKRQTPFREFLRQTRATLLQAFENQNFQFDELVDAIGLSRDPSRNPLFDVMFILQDTETKPVEIPGVRLTPYVFETGTSKVDLTIHMRESEEELECYFEYDTHLFEHDTVKFMSEVFVRFVDRLVGQATPAPNPAEPPLAAYGNVGFAFPEDQYEVSSRPDR